MVLLWIAFFCSGMVGLSYEITWVRYLNQLFGASTPAVAATVSIFFLGLALGAALGGRLFERRRHPLLTYAALEVAIGLCAACVPLGFQLADQWLVGHLYQGAEHPLLWLSVSTLILLLPTTLLGATFPAMAAVVRHRANATHSTGFFYGFNTLGAVFGCLIVSFWLLPGIGQQYTTYAMAAANLLIALMLVGVHRRCHKMLAPQPASPTTQTPQETPRPAARPADAAPPHAPAERLEPLPVETTAPTGRVLSSRMALFLAGCSGCLAIGIEVLWTRALALSFPASQYVFALVLAAYLSGIGLGAVGVGAVFRKRRARPSHLLLLYGAIGGGSVLTLLLFAQMVPWSQHILEHHHTLSLQAYLGWIGAVAVLAMLPATLAMGAALPMLIGLSTRGGEDASRNAGMIYAVNTIGGVLGSLLVTFAILPWLGLSQSLFLLGMGYVGLAFVLARGAAAIPSSLRVAASLSLAFACLAFAVGWCPEANPKRHRADASLLHYQEGASATLAVYENRRGHRDLHINNQPSLTSTQPKVVRMQYIVGHISAMLEPSPKRLMLIGFGAGATLAAASQHGIPSIDCIVRHSQQGLAPLFAKANHRRSWRRMTTTTTRFLSGEPRRLLLRKGPQYDVIVSDLTLPGDPGLGALYSLEQFRAARYRLSPQGSFVVWLPLARFGDTSVAVIAKTFLAVFPTAKGIIATLFEGRPVLGLIGRPAPTPLDPSSTASRKEIFAQHFQRSWQLFHLGYEPLMSLSVAIKSDLAPLRILSNQQLTALAKDAPINRLERPASSLVLSHNALRQSLQRRSHAPEQSKALAHNHAP